MKLPPLPPANDDDENVCAVLDCSFEELLDAIRENGGEVEHGFITEGGEFVILAND